MKCLIVTEHVMLNIFFTIRTGMRSIPVSVALRQRHRCPFGALNTSCLRFSSRGPAKESTRVRCEGVPHQRAPVSTERACGRSFLRRWEPNDRKRDESSKSLILRF